MAGRKTGEEKKWKSMRKKRWKLKSLGALSAAPTSPQHTDSTGAGGRLSTCVLPVPNCGCLWTSEDQGFGAAWGCPRDIGARHRWGWALLMASGALCSQHLGTRQSCRGWEMPSSCPQHPRLALYNTGVHVPGVKQYVGFLAA